MRVGVLALQGDFREHAELLEKLDVQAVKVRRPSDLENIEGLIIPGGESTAISKLLVIFNMLEPVRRFAKVKPVLATCAGLILLSDQVIGRLNDQQLIGGLDIVASRNAYGSQLDSFEANVSYGDISEPVAFIRAPKIIDAKSAKIISKLGDEIVAVQQGNLIAACYHPEITGSTHLHSLFITEIKNAKHAVT